MSQPLKDKIVESAKQSGRSVNSEIVTRLQESYAYDIDAAASSVKHQIARILIESLGKQQERIDDIIERIRSLEKNKKD